MNLVSSKGTNAFGSVTYLVLSNRLSTISHVCETPLRITGKETHQIHDVCTEYQQVDD